MAKGQRIYTSVEICAGAGGQAIGLEDAGFAHRALVEIDPWACRTLRANVETPERVIEGDVRDFLTACKTNPTPYAGLDLLAGGVPCPPFSLAGKQLGADDERDLFPVMLDLVEVLKPRAVMIENVRGLLQAKFNDYRKAILHRLGELGYPQADWHEFNASDFGVPQLRPRSILVAIRSDIDEIDSVPKYKAPKGDPAAIRTVGAALEQSMRDRKMPEDRLAEWVAKASRVAPTLVGGSKKHGGADLGPTRAKRQWAEMGVDAWALAEDGASTEPVVPRGYTEPKVEGPRLTVDQAAVLQGFPDGTGKREKWDFQGGKTARYRQVGNAFPPPVALAVSSEILAVLKAADDHAAKQAAFPSQRPRSATDSPKAPRAAKTGEPASQPR